MSTVKLILLHPQLSNLTFPWKMPIMMWINFHQQQRNDVSHSGNGDIAVTLGTLELLNEILNFFFFTFLTTCSHKLSWISNLHNLSNLHTLQWTNHSNSFIISSAQFCRNGILCTSLSFEKQNLVMFQVSAAYEALALELSQQQTGWRMPRAGYAHMHRQMDNPKL